MRQSRFIIKPTVASTKSVLPWKNQTNTPQPRSRVTSCSRDAKARSLPPSRPLRNKRLTFPATSHPSRQLRRRIHGFAGPVEQPLRRHVQWRGTVRRRRKHPECFHFRRWLSHRPSPSLIRPVKPAQSQARRTSPESVWHSSPRPSLSRANSSAQDVLKLLR